MHLREGGKGLLKSPPPLYHWLTAPTAPPRPLGQSAAPSRPPRASSSETFFPLPQSSEFPELGGARRGRTKRAAMKVSIKTLKGSSFEIEVEPSSKVRSAAVVSHLHLFSRLVVSIILCGICLLARLLVGTDFVLCGRNLVFVEFFRLSAG
jgi:hypothetical protein